MALVAQNGLWLSRNPAESPSLSAGSFIRAIASGDVRLASVLSDVHVTSATLVNVGTTASPQLLQVGLGGDSVAVSARALDVRAGQVYVGDGGRVTLAARGSTAAALDGAGVTVGGGDGVTLATERSIKWSRGVAELPPSEAAATAMAGGRSNVGAWDVRGGGIRIVSEGSDREVAYGFRVNAELELELYRRDILKGSGSATYRRVFRQGYSGGGGASSLVAMLPTSPTL